MVIITKLQVAPVELDVSSQSSQLISTCRASRARRVERVELCSSTSSTQPNAWARHVDCVESSRAKWNLSHNVQLVISNHCMKPTAFSVKLHLRHQRTNKQTNGPTNKRTKRQRQMDRSQKSNVVHFSLKVWHLVALTLMIFLKTNWPNLVYLLVDPGFLSPPWIYMSNQASATHRMEFVSCILWQQKIQAFWRLNGIIQHHKSHGKIVSCLHICEHKKLPEW